MQRLGFTLIDAKTAAHVNNYINDPSSNGKPWNKPQFDSVDDQYSINLG